MLDRHGRTLGRCDGTRPNRSRRASPMASRRAPLSSGGRKIPLLAAASPRPSWGGIGGVFRDPPEGSVAEFDAAIGMDAGGGALATPALERNGDGVLRDVRVRRFH